MDGWRLDAADERPVEFWADWNALVRRINPDAFTSAEVCKDPKSFILNGGFSAVMNYYGFAIPVKGWLIDNHLTVSHFAKDLDNRREAIPRADAYDMQNLIDSHDTDRLASMIVNSGKMPYHDDPSQVEYNSNDAVHTSPTYLIRKPNDRERSIQQMVVLMQMSYVGAPMIYYGDETGMWARPIRTTASRWSGKKCNSSRRRSIRAAAAKNRRRSASTRVYSGFIRAPLHYAARIPRSPAVITRSWKPMMTPMCSRLHGA